MSQNCSPCSKSIIILQTGNVVKLRLRRNLMPNNKRPLKLCKKPRLFISLFRHSNPLVNHPVISEDTNYIDTIGVIAEVKRKLVF